MDAIALALIYKANLVSYVNASLSDLDSINSHPTLAQIISQ